jgi:hypothetical protein
LQRAASCLLLSQLWLALLFIIAKAQYLGLTWASSRASWVSVSVPNSSAEPSVDALIGKLGNRQHGCMHVFCYGSTAIVFVA